ncbi:MAG: TIGR02301 family protein [Parvularcula sp.]|jgi:uncharacterized protein (TIGR02301 family)|nr:TIGR02301 family protein [Parvularcula sp.]
MIALAAALLLTLQTPPPEARQVFLQRQDDLITLAAKLGMLHRLDQLCSPGYRQGMFREHMKAVVEGERPVRATREAMIDSFNQSFRSMADIHLTCSYEAQADMRREAAIALQITDRLSRPLENR